MVLPPSVAPQQRTTLEPAGCPSGTETCASSAMKVSVGAAASISSVEVAAVASCRIDPVVKAPAPAFVRKEPSTRL